MGLGSLSLRRNTTNKSASGQSALQKALERNRKKQMKRQTVMSTSPSSSSLDSLRSRTRTSNATRSSSAPSSPPSRPSSLRSRLSGRSPDITASSRVSGVSSTRKSVASGNDVGFTTPLRKTTRTSPSVNYRNTTRTTTRTTTRKTTAKSLRLADEPWFTRYGVYLGWSFCALLFLRLVFAERGVIDFYKQASLIQQKEMSKQSLIQENKNLEKEIYKLDNDRSFQKKTVRKHLGVIAKDEFLVLFAREVGKSKPKSFRP